MPALAECLEILHFNLNILEDHAVVKCGQQLTRIEQLCSRSLSKEELGLYCSLLLQSKGGILSVLTLSTIHTQHKSLRDQVLSFLSKFILHITNYVDPYIKDIRRACLDVFRRDKYSKNREKALQIIIQVITIEKKVTDGSWVDQFVKVLFEELAKSASKTSATVKGHTLHALGTIALHYPHIMAERSHRLYEIYLRELKKEMVISIGNGDMKVIEGSLNGLRSIMFNFTNNFNENPLQCKEIYNFTRMSIEPQGALQRFGVPIAGMKLMKDHSSHFEEFLIHDYKEYYAALEMWFQHKNSDLRHLAHLTIEAFLKQVSSVVSKESSLEKSKELFIFFIKKFEGMITSDDIDSKALSLAVRGYGLLAGPCKRYIAHEDVSFMFSQMIERCEEMFLSSTKIDDNKIHQLPSFITSLASIASQLMADKPETGSSDLKNCNMPEAFVRSLERLCVIAIGNYPRLHEKFSSFCHGSIVSCVHAFAQRPEVLKKFQDCIVYHGLIRSCSLDAVLGEVKEIVLDPDYEVGSLRNAKEAPMTVTYDLMKDSRMVSYRNFIPLWVALLSGKVVTSLYGEVDTSNLSESFLASFINALTDITSKLNLEVVSFLNKEEQIVDGVILSQADDIKARNVVDFRIFINLCDLCGDVFPVISKKTLFYLHIRKLVLFLISMSTRYPMVSGFYKLLSSMMSVSTTTEYFSSDIVSHKMEVDDHMPCDHVTDRKQTRVLLQKFAIEVSQRSKQFKDELLASTLFFLLSLPVEVAQSILPNLSPSLQRACLVGSGYPPIAEALMKAIYRWKLYNSTNTKLLSELVPCLEPFLHSKNETVVNEGIHEKKLPSRMKVTSVKDTEEPKRKKICLLVMKFFGDLAGNVSDWLEQGKTKKDDLCVPSWSNDLCVEYHMTFRDMKPSIRLDYFVHRVMQNCEQSADRRAKISSCELLHSITIFIIGEESQTGARQNVSSLYKHLLPLLFRLACDSDQVCKQLFEPLINQIIHWFTTNKKYESLNTTILLNTIMDGLIDDNSSSLRLLCATSLREFMSWSIKQNTGPSKTQHNSKSIFKRIYSLALHPAPIRRLGASLAFNSIYRIFREQDSFVDEFVLEVLVTFINCLALSHHDDSSYGTVESSVQVLSHLERIIKVKHTSLCKESNIRRVPKGINHASPITLNSIVMWIFEQTGRPQTECRHQCMRLFSTFIKLLPNHNKSPSFWITQKIKNTDESEIISIFESGCDGFGIATHPDLESMNQNLCIKTVINWFEVVLAALETYSWAFQEKMLSPSVLCTEIFSSNSHLFKSLDCFIQKISLGNTDDIACILAPVSSDASDLIITPEELHRYNMGRCSISSRIMQFTILLLNLEGVSKKAIFPVSFEQSLPSFVASVLTCPYEMGFDTLNDSEVAREIYKISYELLDLLMKYLSKSSLDGNTRNVLISAVKEKVLQKGQLIDLLPAPFGRSLKVSSTSFNIQDLLQSYIVLFKCELLPNVLHKTSPASMMEFSQNLFKVVYSSCVLVSEGDANKTACIFSPDDFLVGRKLLDLIFTIGTSPDYLVDSLINSNIMMSSYGAMQSSAHGGLFLSLYADKIYTELCSKASIYIPIICKHASYNPHICAFVLSGMLDHIATNNAYRIKYSKTICSAILDQLDTKLKCWWRYDGISHPSDHFINNAILLLKKIVALDSTVCHDVNHSNHAILVHMYTSLLVERKLSLTLKNKLLDLLSFFYLSFFDDAEIKNALESLVATHFPLSSREFKIGTPAFTEYKQAITKLLVCLKDVGCITVLEILINIYCREEGHVMSDDILSAFEEAVKIIPTSKQKQVLSLPYLLHSDTVHYNLVFRCNCVCDVLVPMMSLCDVTAVIEFFTDHIVNIMDIIKEDDLQLSSNKPLDKLSMKTLAYRLMELLFSLLPQQHFNSSSTVGYAFANATSSQNKHSILKTFMQCATRDRTRRLHENEATRKETKKFQCFVYNAMIAAVVATQKEVAWYSTFLFDEKPNKNQYFLDNLIDTKKEYKFDTELLEPLKKRKRFVAIRKQKVIQEEVGSDNVLYMSSIYGSSLSKEVNVFDSNLVRTVSRHSVIEDSEVDAIMTDVSDSSNRDQRLKFNNNNYVELESDEINQHECMAPMVALVQHMHENCIGFPPESLDSKDVNPPSWMSSIIKKLTSSSTSKNVRIFIVKLVINCEPCFRKYAADWIAPLMQTYLRGDIGTGEINSMTCDVLATVLSWNSIAVPGDTVEGRNLVRAVVEKLSGNVKSESRSIVRHNLDLIKTTLECWGAYIQEGIDPAVVYHLCGCTDTDSKENFVALQLLGALLANGIAPYASSYPVDRTAYFNRITNNMMFKRKEIYDSASEVSGMILEYFTQVDGEIDGEIHQMVSKRLLTMYGNREHDKFITCLHKVALHHPAIVDKFSAKVFFIMPKLHGELRSKSFEIILQRSDKVPELFPQLKSKSLVSLLSVGDDALQLTCLRLCHRLLYKAMDDNQELDVKEVLHYIFMEVTKNFLKHPNLQCRQEALDIVMDAYDAVVKLRDDQLGKDLLSTAKLYLLRSLNDAEELIRNQVVNFWNAETRLPVDPSSKLSVILRDLYDPLLEEEHFLSNSVCLLLQSASLSPDFQRPLFDNPLSECEFHEYTVDHSWRSMHAGMIPMFMDTFRSSAEGSTSTPATPSKRNVVLATQENLQFSATITGDSKNTYNWMTGGSLDTFSSIRADAVTETKSYLLFSSGVKKAKEVFSSLKPGPDFGKGILSRKKKDETKSNPGIDIDVARLRRRFVKESRNSNYKYARLQEINRKRREQFELDCYKQAKHEVQLHRGYRAGELPDIQIPNRALIVPLAAACQHDPFLSQLVMVLIISGISEKIKESKNKSEERLNDIYEQLNGILRRSQEKCPALIACIEEVFLKRDSLDLKINPSDVTSASLFSNTQELGILVLEQHIIAKSDAIAEPLMKRRKTAPNKYDVDMDIWIELARLYKSLQDYDVLYGIFSTHSSSNKYTTEGLRLEGEGDYRAACKLYEEALKAECDASEVEKDLWEEGLLYSLENLSRWDQVDRMCLTHLGSYEDSSGHPTLEQAWKHPDYIERYLDHALHAKLLLLLEGHVDAGDQLASFMDDAMKKGGRKKTHIEKKFSEYLSMLYIHQEYYDQAKYYLQIAKDNLSSKWSSEDALTRGTQHHLLRNNMRLSDVEEFLNLIEKPASELSLSSIQMILTKWTNRALYSVHDPISAWQDLVAYRCFFLDTLKRKCDSLNPTSSCNDALLLCLLSGKIEMRLRLVENAYSRGNFSLAEKVLGSIEQAYDTFSDNPALCLKLSHQTASYYHARARCFAAAGNAIQSDPHINALLAAYESLNEQSKCLEKVTGKPEVYVEHLLLLATTYEKMSYATSVAGEIATSGIQRMLPSHSDPSDLKRDLLKEAYSNFDGASRFAAKLSLGQYSQLQFKSFMAMAEFCDKQLQDCEDADCLDDDATAKLAKCLTQFVVKSMRLCGGGSTASLKIPRLLYLMDKFEEVKAIFTRETRNLPVWMFLAWVGHMVALLNGDSGPALHHLLLSIAQEYPQALLYPVTTALKDFTSSSEKSSKENKVFLKKLKHKLHQDVPLANEFIKQLQYVSNPRMIFKDWGAEFPILFEKKASVGEKIKSYQNMYNDLFNIAESKSTTDDSSLYGSLPAASFGHLRSKFAKDYKKEMDKRFGGPTGSEIPRMNPACARKHIAELNGKMQNFKDQPKSLKDYSLWLTNFQPLQHGMRDLEIPGQYDGRSRPLVEYHTTIVGFDEQIQVMSSLRKPCRITIRGSDEADHLFLIKEGEDLRQDQRIESVFVSINDILADDVECRKKKLSLITYQVIPVSSKVGLIEWVKDIVPFWDFIRIQADRLGCGKALKRLEHTDWVPENIKLVSQVDRYGSLCNHCNATEVEKKFFQVSNQISRYIFRDAYHHLAANPQAFVVLRRRFVTSYSVMCITHWLLGIGDRHTSNFLISTSSGKSVGIDFGHAFGSATEVLPIPELVPFRLTRQIVNLMAPHSEKSGEFRQVMVTCLNALRLQSDTLLSMLNVFIKDPSVDWTSFRDASEALPHLPKNESVKSCAQTFNQCDRNQEQEYRLMELARKVVTPL